MAAGIGGHTAPSLTAAPTESLVRGNPKIWRYNQCRGQQTYR
ncbi:UNVERIFIED_ORG: hypothetical protein J2X79_004245 [Arthrobacter globiformis]|nr:hypothetical protein [Arthrobacter globiformis]